MRIFIKCICLIASFQIFTAIGFAEGSTETCEQATARIFSKISETGEIVSIANDIDWDGLFERSKTEGKLPVGVNSSSDYKAWFVSVNSNKASLPVATATGSGNLIPGNSMNLLPATIARLNQERQRRYKEMKISVLSSTEANNQAEVAIDMTFGGTSANTKVLLSKVNSSWLLLDPGFGSLVGSALSAQETEAKKVENQITETPPPGK